MPTGTWIYEKGTTSGGGGTIILPDAPPVVIGAVNVREIYNGKFEVTVEWTPGDGPTTVGVGVFVEDPDMSAAATAPLDGTVPLDGSSSLSGKWAPKRETDSFVSPAIIEVLGKPAERDIRIYLQAYGTVKNATLVRANHIDPTPSVVATIPASAGEYVSGQEHAWIVTDASAIVVEDFDNPAGPKYHLTFSYTPPDPAIPLPPGLRPFGGVMLAYEYDDGTIRQALFLDVNHPDAWISGDYDAGNGGHFKVWFPSRDVDGNVNTIVKGVTPMVDVTVVYPPDGEASAPFISELTISDIGHEAQPDGTVWAVATLHWTNPDSPRFALVTFYRTGVTPPRKFRSASGVIVSMKLEVIDWPKIAENWVIVAISTDFNGKPSADPASPGVGTPFVTWHIGPPGAGSTGGEYTVQVGIGGATITTEQELNNDGVVMIRHIISGWTNPSDNSFGGVSIARVYGGGISEAIYWDASKEATTMTTDWEPAPTARTWDFYFVSRDMSGHRNSIFPGVTPHISHTYTPIANAIIPSRLPPGWWNPAEFEWPAYPAGYFQALTFVAKKIFVGSILRVGGGTGTNDPTFGGQENGQIAVYNSSNVLRAWFGQHDSGTPDNPSFHTIFGGWVAELYIGGDGPPTAPIYAKQDGTVIVGGFEITGSRYPYISIRRNDGVEVGRMGARIGQGLVSTGDPAYIGGAWFREFSCGGASLADWRLLARQNPTNSAGGDLFNLRNINKFTIDYIANYPSTTNPTNAAMHMEFGYDAFVTDISSTAFYKFPGFTIYRTGTSHGMVMVNRGVIMKGAEGNRRVFLGSYNGDGFGSDSPSWFWGELSLYSPSSGQINVYLSSGNVSNGNSTFYMKNQSSTTTFQVDNSGNVFILGSLNITGTTTFGAINGTTLTLSGGANINGTLQTNGNTIFCGAVNAGSNAGNFGTIFVSNVNCSSQVNANTLNTTNGIIVNGTTRTNSTGIWLGGVQCNDHIFGSDFGIEGVSAGVAGPTTFTTVDGKTVTVRGGIIIGIV